MQTRTVLAGSLLALFGSACTPTRYVELKVPGTAPMSHYECKRNPGDEPGAAIECTEVGATSLPAHDNTTYVIMPSCQGSHLIRIESAETDHPTVRVICAQVGN